MAIINLDELSPSYWFDYDNEGAAVKIRPPTQEVLTRINREYVKPRVEYKRLKGGRYERFEFNEVDREGLQDAIHRWVVADWRGFKDPQGNEVPYDPDLAVQLMRKDPAFYAFVDRKLDFLADQQSSDPDGGPEKN